MKKKRTLLRIFCLSTSILCLNCIQLNNDDLVCNDKSRNALHKFNSVTNYSWYCYRMYRSGAYTYRFYYDRNNQNIIETFTGISIEANEYCEEEISCSSSYYCTENVEVGITKNYSINASAKVYTAKVELETEIESSFGLSYEKTCTTTYTSVLTHNQEEGFGTYYLYMNSIVTTYKIEKVRTRTGQIIQTKIIENSCDSQNDKFELTKKQPKISLPLLGIC